MWMVGDEHSLIREVAVAGIVSGHFGRFKDGNEWEWTISISRWFLPFFSRRKNIETTLMIARDCLKSSRVEIPPTWNPSHFVRCFSHRFHWFSPMDFPYVLKKSYVFPLIFPHLTNMSYMMFPYFPMTLQYLQYFDIVVLWFPTVFPWFSTDLSINAMDF